MARVSATLTLLSAAAISAQSTCTYDDSSCTYTCGAAKFALSSIAVPAAGYFTATGGDTPYYFNLCADKYSEYVWRDQYWEYAERYGLNQPGLNQHSLGGEVSLFLFPYGQLY